MSTYIQNIHCYQKYTNQNLVANRNQKTPHHLWRQVKLQWVSSRRQNNLHIASSLDGRDIISKSRGYIRQYLPHSAISLAQSIKIMSKLKHRATQGIPCIRLGGTLIYYHPEQQRHVSTVSGYRVLNCTLFALQSCCINRPVLQIAPSPHSRGLCSGPVQTQLWSVLSRAQRPTLCTGLCLPACRITKLHPCAPPQGGARRSRVHARRPPVSRAAPHPARAARQPRPHGPRGSGVT